MAKFYKVELTEEEREALLRIIRKGKHTSQVYRNAYILLNTDETDEGSYSEKITNAEITKVLKSECRQLTE